MNIGDEMIRGPIELDLGVKYTGSSSDTKPTENLRLLSEVYETDTTTTYVSAGSTWVEKKEENS